MALEVFGAKDMARIRRAVKQILGEPRGRQIEPRPPVLTDRGTHFAKTPTDGIPAIDGTKLGQAECEIYKDNELTTGQIDLEKWTLPDATTKSETVYNYGPAVEGDAYITITLSKLGQWFVDDAANKLLAFKLTEIIPIRGAFTVNAILIDKDGTEYGDTIQVKDTPLLGKTFGPAAIGFTGFCTKQKGAAASDAYVVVNMQQFAEFIIFGGAGMSPNNYPPCQSLVSVEKAWDGEDPKDYSPWAPWVDGSNYEACDCVDAGVAVLDGAIAEYPRLFYRVVESPPKFNDIIAGTGVRISGNCDRIISVDDGIIEAGDCIDVTKTGTTTTIASTVNVIGGDGIEVQKSQCTYSISLAGKEGNPTTAIQFVCDIVCTDNGDGTYTQTVKYGTLTLPTSIINSLVSECEDPLYTCDDCADCAVNEIKILKDDGSECDCILDTAAMPEGWTACPTGPGIVTVDSINCTDDSPNAAITIHTVPDNATKLIITIIGTDHPQGTVGTILNPTPGQTYFIALVDGWSNPGPYECFTISMQWKDQGNNDIGTPIVSSDWCCPV